MKDATGNKVIVTSVGMKYAVCKYPGWSGDMMIKFADLTPYEPEAVETPINDAAARDKEFGQ